MHWVREGAIGKVKEWHSWVGPGAIFTTDDKKYPAGNDPIPEHLDWNLWCGTGPLIPFKEGEYHPFWWRRYRAFGGGAVGDFGCHIFDPVYSALDITNPLQVLGRAESYSDEVHPAWSVINYTFPGTPMTTYGTIATWRGGGLGRTSCSPHPRRITNCRPAARCSSARKALIIPHVGKPQLHPVADFENPVPQLEERSHYHEFVDACLGRVQTTGSNFDFAGPMAEAVLLGNIANRLPGQALEWNARRCRFSNNRDANKLLRRSYRDGFEVRGL